MKVKLAQLGERNRKHPDIERNTDAGVCPGNGADTQAFSTVFSIPLRPVVADRLALEGREDDEKDAKADVEYHSAPEHSANRSLGKDLQVEEQHRHLEQRDLQEVQDRHDIEEHSEVGDLCRSEGPDVSSQSIRNHQRGVDDGAWYAGHQRDENEPVIHTRCHPCHAYPEAESQEHSSRADASQSHGQDVRLLMFVPWRNLTYRFRDIFRDCTLVSYWPLDI